MTDRTASHDETSTTATNRLFVALPLPATCRTGLMTALGPLVGVETGLRWVRSEQLHVTLKFLGERPASDVARIVTALDGVRWSAPLLLRFAGTGRFPPSGRPRVYWVGLAGDTDRLVRLAADIDAVLTPLGIPRERRPLQPHLTVARVARVVPPRRFEVEYLDRGRDLQVEIGAIERFVLYRSELRPTGAVHTALREFGGRG